MTAVERSPTETSANKYFRRFSKHFGKPSSPDPLTVNIRLPSELWLEILTYLNGPEIAPLTLTCRALRAVSQPLLFRRIVLRPFADSDIFDRAGALMIGSTATYRTRFNRRLEFFLSPGIAPMVEEVCIMPHGKQPKRPKAVEDMVIDCFNALPQFVNLERLACCHVPLNMARAELLQQLPLKYLMLEHCYTQDGGHVQTWSQSSIESLTLGFSDGPEDAEALEIFSAFMNPLSLRSLSSGPATRILPMLTVGRPYHLLQDLDLSANCVLSPNFVPALYQVPNLERLALRQANPTQPAPRPLELVPADAIPLLKFYSGPRRYVLNICAPRPVHTLEITPTALPDKLGSCFSRMKGCLAGSTIEVLSIRAHDVDAPLFAKIHACCTKLRHFTVKGCSPLTADWMGLFHELNGPVSSMRTLRLFTRLGSDPYDPFHIRPAPREERDMIKFFREIQPALTQCYPSLKKFQVSYNVLGHCATLRKQSSKRKIKAAEAVVSRPATGHPGIRDPASLIVGNYHIELGTSFFLEQKA